MDFNNHVLFTFELFGREILFTDTQRTTYIIMAILIIFAAVVRIKLNKFEEVPKGFQNVVEAMVEMFDNFVVGAMDEKYSYFGNWFFALFAFILLSNLSGLFTLRPPTADLATTAAFGLSTFVLINFMAIKTQPKNYFKGYLEPFFLFLPMNIVGTFATPISLSFRMFGNILGGTIIMGMIYSLPFYFKIGIPAFLHIYFDVFSAFLQTFIFVMLSMTFIRDALPE